MKFLDRLYRNFNSLISEKDGVRFCRESRQMITPCGKIFEGENVHSVITKGSNHMRADGFRMTHTSGDVRLGMGLYRTPEESEKYIEESLKRPLP